MGDRMRTIDWAATALGPVERWSPALRQTVGLLLRSPFPLLLWWGPHFVQLYNDACRELLGEKHPQSLGQVAAECWRERWHVIGPMIEAPFSGLPATTRNDFERLIDRHGFVEEKHFKIGCSPVPDDTVPGTGVGGVLATVADISGQVFADRQWRALLELGTRTPRAMTPEGVCESAAVSFEAQAADVPFALFYLSSGDGTPAHLAAACGFEDARDPACPVARILESGRPEVLRDLSGFGDLPRGPWAAQPHTAIALPLTSPAQPHPYGVLIAACNPHRRLDENYRTFFELAASQVATAIGMAKACEEQRRRAEQAQDRPHSSTARHEAESASHVRDEFLMTMSHELRTPLNAILGWSRLLEIPGLAAATSDRARESIERNARALAGLIEDLLDLSRMVAGRLAMEREPMDFGAAIEAAVDASLPTLAARGITIDVDVEPAARLVIGDRHRLQQVVSNLLTNATRFTPDGGHIDVALTLSPEGPRLTVSDSGAGIVPEALPSIFERLRQADSASTRSHGSLGLGLAIVRNVVELHGGTVRAESDGPGCGSRFIVVFPGPDEELHREPVISPATIDIPSLAGRRVLVLDDDRESREVMAAALGASCADVTLAASAREALAAIDLAVPDVIVSDIALPGEDGFSFLARLRTRAEEDVRRTPVLAVTAYARAEDRDRVFAAGFDAYLSKPTDPADLVSTVARLAQAASAPSAS